MDRGTWQGVSSCAKTVDCSGVVPPLLSDCLIGLVVKVSASKVADLGFNFPLSGWRFFRVELYQ